MSTFRMIPTGDLVRRPDVRPTDNDALDALAESIDALGLMNPLTVRPLPDGKFEIIAGSHRYAACDSLDHHEIPCQVIDMDDLHAEMAMIDENLHRAELSPTNRARQTARRKAIYEELHPETVNGVNQHTRVGQVGQPSFVDATAAATGQSERAVRRDAERGEKVIDEVLDMIRGTKLDTGAYLDKLKRLPPNEQVHAAKRDLVISRQQAQQPASPAQKLSNDPKSLKLAVRDARASVHALTQELHNVRSENADLRDQKDTLRHEISRAEGRVNNGRDHLKNGGSAYEEFIALSDALLAVEAKAVLNSIPTNVLRASLCGRVRSLLALLEDIDALLEGGADA